MSKPHEYSKIEHITDKKSKKAFFAIPNLGKVKKSDKKIQFISFLAEWCPNCEYEAIELSRYTKEYRSLVDFSIVMMFSSVNKSSHFLSNYKLNTELIDSECNVKSELLNERTSFFNFRLSIDDNRKWGVPLHVIRLAGTDKEKILSIKGESIKEEVRLFLNKSLKLA